MFLWICSALFKASQNSLNFSGSLNLKKDLVKMNMGLQGGIKSYEEIGKVLPQGLQAEQHAPGRKVEHGCVGKAGCTAGWGCARSRLNLIAFSIWGSPLSTYVNIVWFHVCIPGPSNVCIMAGSICIPVKLFWVRSGPIYHFFSS